MNFSHTNINNIQMVTIKINPSGLKKQFLSFLNHFINILQVNHDLVLQFHPTCLRDLEDEGSFPQPRSPTNHLYHTFSSHTWEKGSGTSNKLPETGTESQSWPVVLASINSPRTQ